MSGSATHRLKAKFADGREQEYTNRDGSTGRAVRITIGTIFTDEEGKMNVSFEGPMKAAIIKALGGGDEDRVYFDVYPTEGGSNGNANRKAPKPAASVRDDW